MSITTLGLTPQEYLSLFDAELPKVSQEHSDNPQMEIRSIWTDAKISSLCQRIAIVFAACHEAEEKDEQTKSVTEKHWEIEPVGNLLKNKYQDNPLDIDKIVLTTFIALIDPSQPPLTVKTKGVFPIASLRTVVDYLVHVYGKFQKIEKDPTSGISKLREDFDNCIRKEQFFNGWEETIQDKRKALREQAAKATESECSLAQ